MQLNTTQALRGRLSLSPPLLLMIAFARGHNILSIILINEVAQSHQEEWLVDNCGAGGNNFVM
jgi:hypothetical protein